MRKFVIVFFIIFLIAFDLGSKYFITEYVFGTWKDICNNPTANSSASYEYCKEDTISFSEYFSFRLSHNAGIAFSLPIEGILLQILTIFIILFLLYHYTREEYPKDSRLIDIWYILIFGWAISHAYERISAGHVVDFISVKYFAILNFADIFISIGALLLIIAYVREHRKHR